VDITIINNFGGLGTEQDMEMAIMLEMDIFLVVGIGRLVQNIEVNAVYMIKQRIAIMFVKNIKIVYGKLSL
jgi:hypothetical protein